MDRPFSFFRWASVCQAGLAVYLIGASLFRASLQDRHREFYTAFASQETNSFVVVTLAKEATKAAEWAQDAAWHTLVAGFILLALSIRQLVVSNSLRQAQLPQS